MQNISLPPTREDVVKKTLKRSPPTAQEYGDKYAIATYDLAVAKIAIQIQIHNSPEFDDRVLYSSVNFTQCYQYIYQ